MNLRRLLVTAAALLASAATASGQGAARPRPEGPLGVQVVPAPEALAAHLPAVKPGQSLLVTEAPAASKGALLGLKQYDVILSVGEEAAGDLRARLAGLASSGEPIRIVRAGREITLSSSNTADPLTAKSLFKAGAPPAVTVEMKPLDAGKMEVNLSYLNAANKMELHCLRGTVDTIEQQVGDLAEHGKMPANIHDLVGVAIQRLRDRRPAAPAAPVTPVAPK